MPSAHPLQSALPDGLSVLDRFALFVSIFNIVFGLGMAYASLKLATSIIASIAGLAGFTFLLWIFWLAA